MAPRPSRIEAKAIEASKQRLHCNKVCTFPGLKREERREKREERREKREERREKRSQKRPPEIPK